MYLYLDDVRTAPAVATHTAKSFSDAVSLIMNLSNYREWAECGTLSLDHDLGNDADGTGYSLVCWLETQAMLGNWKVVPKNFKIHSANPVGCKNMQAGIDSIKRMFDLV